MFLAVTFTLYLWTIAGTKATPYTRLEKRMNILEQKLFQDTQAFREDISTILEKLSKFNLSELKDSSAAETMVIETEQSEIDSNKAINSDKAFQDEKQMKTDDKTEKARVQCLSPETILRLRQAFQEEKQFLRQYLTEFSVSTLEKLDSTVKAVEKLKMDISNQDHVTRKYLAEFRGDVMNHLGSVSGSIAELKSDISNQNIMHETTNRKLENVDNDLKNFSLNIQEVHNETSLKLKQAVNMLSASCLSQGWSVFLESCYHAYKSTVTWDEAETKCKELGAHLAEIDSKAEYEFLVILTQGTNPIVNVWLGGSDVDKEGKWIWTHSGRPIEKDVSFWDSGEPNGNTGENCLHINYRLKWNDVDCSTKFGFICERSN